MLRTEALLVSSGTPQSYYRHVSSLNATIRTYDLPTGYMVDIFICECCHKLENLLLWIPSCDPCHWTTIKPDLDTFGGYRASRQDQLITP
ncbi:hypothetical protein B0O80DRAFT_109244 [Mortierella sp. GBAus27b]|nr:hypothetical protein B0O80DRAFT_109244 [Mortierella sp. GBAus27b]